MAKIQSKYASGKLPMPIPVAQEVLAVHVTLALTAAQVAAGNVLDMLILPADCVPVGYNITSTDLDSNGAPTIALDLGILNDAETAISTDAADGGDEWLDGSTLAQAGGLALHTASKSTFDVVKAVQVAEEDRHVAIVIATGPATAQAGTVGLELLYRAA
jgi:hypothetical protein